MIGLPSDCVVHASSLRRRFLQVRSGPVVHSPLLLLDVMGGLYVDTCLPEVWVVFVSCVASVVKRSSVSVSLPLASFGWGLTRRVLVVCLLVCVVKGYHLYGFRSGFSYQLDQFSIYLLNFAVLMLTFKKN